jgi:predicted PurR-regulated permease PerM
MDNKKIMNRSNMLGFLTTMILVVGFFIGGYLIFAENMQDSGKVVNSQYTTFYQQVNQTSTNLNNRGDDINNNLQAIKETENPLQMLWNGMKGLGSSLLAFRDFSLDSSALVAQTFNIVPIIPTWIQSLITLFVLIFVVFLIYKVIKGEPGAMSD